MASHKSVRLVASVTLIIIVIGIILIIIGLRGPMTTPSPSTTEAASDMPSTATEVKASTVTPMLYDNQSVGRDAAQSLVQLVVPTDGSGHIQGSGSIVEGERGLILTNWHIMGTPSGIPYNEGGYAKVYLTQGIDRFPRIAYWAQLLIAHSDYQLDLALLQITHRADDLGPVQRPLDLPSLSLKGRESVHTGDHVLLLGFPDYAVGRPSWSEGYIVTHDSRWIKSDAEIGHGNSGGMMLNQQGELIGIPTEYEDTSVRSVLVKARPVDLASPLIKDALSMEPIPSQPLRRRPSTTDTLRVVVGTNYLYLYSEEGLWDNEIGEGTLVEILDDPMWENDTLWHYVQVVGTRVVMGWADASYLASWEVVREPILFASDRSGSFDLYCILLDGTGLVRLTDAPGNEAFPSWSPGRDAIVFSSNRNDNLDLFVMSLNGGDWEQLTDDDADDLYPAWSPDGSRIAFASDRDGDWELFVIDADGTDLRQLTFNKTKDVAPTWSPDGTRLAYTSRRGGNDDLYLLDLETKKEEQITTNPYDDANPSWAPQGDELAYVAVTPQSSAGRRQIAVLNVGDPESVRTVAELEPGVGSPGYVTWSSDGEWLLYTTRQDGDSEIYLTPATGVWSANLTVTEFADDETPAW